MRINLAPFKSMRTIEYIRKRFPEVKWKYEYPGTWVGSDESFVWSVAACSCDTECDHGGRLCRYFKSGEKTPEWL